MNEKLKNYHSIKMIIKRVKMGQPVKNGMQYEKCTLATVPVPTMDALK